MQSKKLILLIGLINCLHLQAENLPNDSIIKRIWKQYMLFPREKLYTMTDKSSYTPGDTIWFRNFLADAATLQEKTNSRYVYTELISPNDTLISRIKQTKDKDGAIYGYIPIPFHLQTGKYMIRCYTKYQQNSDYDKFFIRPIHIISADSQHSEEKKETKDDNYHVGFYPEGGILIAGELCRIAFKAETPNRRSTGMHGWVIENKQDTVCSFQPMHNGMGDFSFIPQAGKNYHAICYNSSGKEKTFRLPDVYENGYALKTKRNNRTTYVSFTHGQDTPTDGLQLIAVAADMPVYAGHWDCEKQTDIAFPDSLFKGGVVNFFLCRNGHVVSKRSIFVRQQHAPDIHISAQKPALFKQRTKISLNIDLKEAITSTAALSVTNSSHVLPDSLQSICSELLLASDLNGPIEDPAWYFRHPDTKTADYCLDLLMLTQAWCRYDIESILKEKYRTPDILPETSANITGKIHTQIGKKGIKDVSVRLHPFGTSQISQTVTDDNGFFCFQGLEFPDSTKYMLSAERKGGKNNVVLTIEPERYPKLQNTAESYLPFHSAEPLPFSVHYEEQAIKRMTIQNGIRNYHLADLTVTARQRKEYENEFEAFANVTLKEEEISQSPIQEIGAYIRSRTGVDFYTFRGGVRKSKSDETSLNHALVLDGNIIEDLDMIKYMLNGGLNKDDIQQIDILKGISCIGYFNGKFDLIISLMTKQGKGGALYVDTNFGYVMPLGIQKPAEFYSPHYSEKQTSGIDNRTTIYWHPTLSLKKEKQTFHFTRQTLLQTILFCWKG